MVPRSTIGRFALALWIAATVGLLAFAYLQRGMHDMPIALTWLLLALNFPSSILAALIVAAISNFSMSSGFASTLVLWIVFTVFGFLQWFALLPWLWCRMRSGRSQVRLIVLAITFFAAALWGFGELSEGSPGPFVFRILACMGLAALALWWAARPTRPPIARPDNDA